MRTRQASRHLPMTRAWELPLEIDRSSALPPFLQIARALATEIQRGRLRPGDALPGSRQLARSLGVHRNTVLAALAELSTEGWLASQQGKATFVAASIPVIRGRAISRRLGVRTKVPTQTAIALPVAPAGDRAPALPRGTLALSSGAPDVRLVPAKLLGSAYRRVLALNGPTLLGYGEPEGYPALRAALATMLSQTRGLAITADHVVVTRGSQMALALIARVLVQPGDLIAVESLGYRPAWRAFEAAGAQLVPIEVDSEGVNVSAIAALTRRRPLRAVYVTPHHQYPTTVTLSASRRLALLGLAREHRFAIVEDDYDHEFHFDGRPVLPLASADEAGSVIYVGTLSKVLAPGLRIGYLVAPEPIVERVAAIRSVIDVQGDRATEAAVATLMEDGEVQRHVARTRRVYAERRETLAASLHRTFGDDVRFVRSRGGMALWTEFRMKADLDAWAQRSLARGVSWFPGKRYAFNQAPIPFARFSYAGLNPRELVEAVKRLAAARRP